MKKLLSIIVPLVLVSIAFGWRLNSPPFERVTVLQQQLQDRLRESRAETYAPDRVQAIEESLVKLENDLRLEGKRLPFMRDYSSFERRFAALKQEIQDLKELAATSQQHQTDDFQRRFQQVVELANQVDDALQSAPLGKGALGILTSMREELGTIRNEIGNAQSTQRAGDPHRADQQLEASHQHAAKLLKEILDAKERARAVRSREQF